MFFPYNLDEAQHQEATEESELNKVVNDVLELQQIQESRDERSGQGAMQEFGSVEYAQRNTSSLRILDRDPMDIMNFVGPIQRSRGYDKITYYPSQREMVHGEQEVFEQDKGWRYVRTVTAGEELFKDFVTVKMRHINFWLQQCNGIVDPFLLDDTTRYRQRTLVPPTPVEILRITLQLWSGRKVECSKDIIPLLLSPIANLCINDRMICPYCMHSEPVNLSLHTHFTNSHWKNRKQCICGKL